MNRKETDGFVFLELFMTLAFLLPFLVALVFLAVVARTTVFRPRPHKIDHVILFVRKLDVSDFEVLLDAGQEWTLRQSLSDETCEGPDDAGRPRTLNSGIPQTRGSQCRSHSSLDSWRI